MLAGAHLHPVGAQNRMAVTLHDIHGFDGAIFPVHCRICGVPFRKTFPYKPLLALKDPNLRPAGNIPLPALVAGKIEMEA
jgi:hypothetical protein